ncbi:radical SAM family heme chaperone HemW [Evansella sp. AB-rgal1]|uniref:radical SAM family heme chaperone HemW n=1 Tax=Evansella sp. AB-rgal1 TaxID=3242696 RepID=UPI00359E81EB
MEPRGVYVHVPFCEQICHYCDFNKFYLKKQPVDEYLDLCDIEIKNTLQKFPTNGISSIYVGGGTPTSLSTKQLEKLLFSIKHYFPIHPEYEWTVEVNPGSADEEKLRMMKEIGVNRLSIGAQTFDPILLKKIGRDHQAHDVEKTIRKARDIGIENISIDLMFGLPDQTIEQFVDTLHEAVSLPIEHVSAYSLKIEAKTIFYHQMQKGNLSLPGEDMEAEMYERLRTYMNDNGFEQYEISNFGKEGYQSQHNLTYWNNESYYGIGAGSHSYVDGVRRINHGPLPKYMDSVIKTGFPYREEHPVPLHEQMEEEMFMGLRKIEGVSLPKFEQKYEEKLTDVFAMVIPSLIERGLVHLDESTIRLTEKGLLLGNEVFEKFLLVD